MPPILVPSSANLIITQILVTEKLNGRKNLILKGCVYYIFPSKQLPVQS